MKYKTFLRSWRYILPVAALWGLAGLGSEAAMPKVVGGLRAAEPAAAEITRAEREIAAWVLAELRAEMELATFAQKRSENLYVRHFAAEVERENRLRIEKWRRWAPEVEEATPNPRGPDGATNWPSLHRALREQFNASVMRRLESHAGAAFDRAYFQAEIEKRSRHCDAMEVLARHATPRLRNDVEVLQEMQWRRLRLAKEQFERSVAASAIAHR